MQNMRDLYMVIPKEPRSHNIHNILEESRESKNVVQRESYVGGRGLVSSGSATQGEE
jgi:hypothetical protein